MEVIIAYKRRAKNYEIVLRKQMSPRADFEAVLAWSPTLCRSKMAETSELRAGGARMSEWTASAFVSERFFINKTLLFGGLDL